MICLKHGRTLKCVSNTCALTVYVEGDVFVRALQQRATVSLTHVNGPVRLGRYVDRQLYGGQLAAVKPGFGEAVYAFIDCHAVVPPAHFHRRITGRRLARKRGLHARL